MSCTRIECLDAVVEALNSPSVTDWLAFAIAGLGTLVVSAAAVAVAAWTLRFDQRRALASDRENLQRDLREWFQTLSRSAAESTRRQQGALRSRIDEAAHADGWVEIFALMGRPKCIVSRTSAEPQVRSIRARLISAESY